MLHSFSKATSTGQTSLVKISDGSIKSVPASSQLSKPGTTVLRVSGGVITTAAAPAVALPTNGVAQVRHSTPVFSNAVLAFLPWQSQERTCAAFLPWGVLSSLVGLLFLQQAARSSPWVLLRVQALPSAGPGCVQRLSLPSTQGSCGTAAWQGAALARWEAAHRMFAFLKWVPLWVDAAMVMQAVHWSGAAVHGEGRRQQNEECGIHSEPFSFYEPLICTSHMPVESWCHAATASILYVPSLCVGFWIWAQESLAS